MEDEKEIIQASEITLAGIKAADIETSHIAIGIMNIETGKQGVKHLYSDAYRERWPQDQYPEKYEEDVPVD